ncbi:MAG: N-acyl homoserine lactonase family protein [Pseudomonadota bacterium]
MKIHAIQTGSVRIKKAQVEGRGHGFGRQLAIFSAQEWTDWLPTYAWAIEHSGGVVVVDTGQGAHLLESRKSLHPYVRWEVNFQIEPDQEIGPQLRALGIGPRDINLVVLTHLHMDHDGGLGHFPDTKILVARGELEAARGWKGMVRGYLPNRWPAWFDPEPFDLDPAPLGPFRLSKRLTPDGDIIAIATPGHTADHISILARADGVAYFIAGDTSYNEDLMLAGKVDGVSADEKISVETLGLIKRFTEDQPTVYLPTHDPLSAHRLTTRSLVGQSGGTP